MTENIEDTLRYDLMVEKALRGVVKHALEIVKRDGLPGEHHFYITFRTQAAGVDIPKYLADQYPEEMTIVLQYQFYGLKVSDKILEVTLSFNNVPERLVIPMEAITVFADPSVNFALQFQPADDDEAWDEDDLAELEEVMNEVAARTRIAGEDDNNGDDDKPSGKKSKKKKPEAEKEKVVSMDQFRKKK